MWSGTIEIMLPSRGGSWAEAFVGTHRVGGIIACYYPAKQVETVTMPRTGYVHVTGIPDTVRPRRLQQALERVWPNPDGTMKERRVWRASADLIPNNVKNALLRDRQVTVGWSGFKSVMQNMVELRLLSDDDGA